MLTGVGKTIVAGALGLSLLVSAAQAGDPGPPDPPPEPEPCCEEDYTMSPTAEDVIIPKEGEGDPYGYNVPIGERSGVSISPAGGCFRTDESGIFPLVLTGSGGGDKDYCVDPEDLTDHRNPARGVILTPQWEGEGYVMGNRWRFAFNPTEPGSYDVTFRVLDGAGENGEGCNADEDDPRASATFNYIDWTQNTYSGTLKANGVVWCNSDFPLKPSIAVSIIVRYYECCDGIKSIVEWQVLPMSYNHYTLSSPLTPDPRVHLRVDGEEDSNPDIGEDYDCDQTVEILVGAFDLFSVNDCAPGENNGSLEMSDYDDEPGDWFVVNVF